MTVDEYRCLALELPQATEASHMNHPDFRVKGKIFATLWPDDRRGVLKLTPEQQITFMQADPDVFEPATGAWGERGMTIVHLEAAEKKTVHNALLMAWRNVAPKSLQKVTKFDQDERGAS